MTADCQDFVRKSAGDCHCAQHIQSHTTARRAPRRRMQLNCDIVTIRRLYMKNLTFASCMIRAIRDSDAP